jgi:hypothetical protein
VAEKFNTYRFADCNKEPVIDLLTRVCTVSVETMKIVRAMPEINTTPTENTMAKEPDPSPPTPAGNAPRNRKFEPAKPLERGRGQSPEAKAEPPKPKGRAGESSPEAILATISEKIGEESAKQTDELFAAVTRVSPAAVTALKESITKGDQLLVSKNLFDSIVRTTVESAWVHQKEVTRMAAEKQKQTHFQRMTIIVLVGTLLLLSAVGVFWGRVLPQAKAEVRVEENKKLEPLQAQIGAAEKALKGANTKQKEAEQRANDAQKNLSEVTKALADAEKKLKDLGQEVEAARKVIAARKRWVSVIDSPAKYSLLPLARKLENLGRTQEANKYLVDREPISVEEPNPEPVKAVKGAPEAEVKKAILTATEEFGSQLEGIKERRADCLAVHWHALRPKSADVDNNTTNALAENNLLIKIASAFHSWPPDTTSPVIVLYSRSTGLNLDMIKEWMNLLKSQIAEDFNVNDFTSKVRVVPVGGDVLDNVASSVNNEMAKVTSQEATKKGLPDLK